MLSPEGAGWRNHLAPESKGWRRHRASSHPGSGPTDRPERGCGRLLESSNYNWGFNAATGQYQDLLEAGVVVRTALQDAASVASLLITTEALVADTPKKANVSALPKMDF